MDMKKSQRTVIMGRPGDINVTYRVVVKWGGGGGHVGEGRVYQVVYDNSGGGGGSYMYFEERKPK